MSGDKIIQGNFGPKPDEGDGIKIPPVQATIGDNKAQVQLSPDQEKAMGLILSGIAFVFIGIKPTDGGGDFFTALHGDPTTLRNAEDHLPDVIGRLYGRKGI